MKRSIYADASGPTLDEKLFRYAKRFCIVFAIFAVTISALDLMNVRVAESAAQFIHDRDISIARLPNAILARAQNVSLTASDDEFASIAVPIPRSAVAERTDYVPMTTALLAIGVSPAPAPAVEKTRKASPVDGLAEVGQLDAIEVAMESPLLLEKPVATMPAVDSGESAMTRPVQLASVNPSEMPVSAIAPPPEPIQISLPALIAFLPPPAPGVPPPSPAQRLKLEGKTRAKAERCLANAVYFESRSEPLKGQIAVAQVVINRVFSPFYPNDVCGVVYQNAHRRLACQFTFACDGKPDIVTERGSWLRANRIAKQVLDGQLYEPAVGTSTHYHAIYVRPNWVRDMKKNVRFGIHNFYRPVAWGNGADAPIWSIKQLAAMKKKN